jgi:TonB-linked SusC/RagA family outer membrane protein
MRTHRSVRGAIALSVTLTGLAFAASSTARGQGAIITGRVTTEFGTVVPTEVLIEELGISTIVDDDGRYTLTIPSARLVRDSVRLRARAVTYRFQDKVIALREGTQTEDFVLTKDVNRLNTVIVVGTATPTESRKLPYSVARFDSSDLPVRGVNVLSALQAKLPGVLVVQPSGRPGTGPAFVMRGPKSINADDAGMGTTACICPFRIPGGRSQEPLIIVDGAILNGGVQDLNPDDIESIEVIKGAAASTLWGSRAGAGVIQMTTKRASQAKDGVSFSIRSEAGFNDVQDEYPFARRHFLLMDETNRRFCIKVDGQPPCSRVVDFEEEQRRINDVYSPAALPPRLFERDYGVSVNPSKPELRGLFQVNQWPVSYNPISQVVRNGALFSNSVDVTGRSAKTSYFTSLSDVSQEGAFRYLRGYRRSSGRLNVDQALGDGSDLRLSSTFARGRLYGAMAPTGGGQWVDVTDEWFQGITRVPAGANLRQRDARGRLFIRPNPLTSGSFNTNPLYGFENLDSYQDDDRFTGSLSGRYAATSWLSFDATASADRRRTYELGYIDRDYRTTAEFGLGNGGTRGFIAETLTSDLSSNVMLGGKGEFTFGDELRGAVIARYSGERQDRQNNWAKGQTLSYSGLTTLANATEGITNFSARTSATAIGVIGGGQLEYRDRYIFDGLIRYDGSSLFGAEERWHPYFRTSMAWRLSDESFWPGRDVANDVKLRASVGSAGGRPNMTAQYETFALSAGGAATPQTMGNSRLKPEHTLETEFGIDAELFHRFGLNVTYARDITRDQLLIVPAPVASGFTRQWQNAGTLDGRTWELSLRVPLLAAKDLSWSAQIGWDRQRTYITELNTLPFMQTFGDNLNNGYAFLIEPGMRFGTMFGRRLATDCSQLPAPFNEQCGPGREWQRNDDGYVVWVGEGYSWRDGLTRNLWQAVRSGCLGANGARIAVQGEVECEARGGTVNSPWGLMETSWGMPTVLRDSTAVPIWAPLGNTMPDYRVTMSHSVRWRRLSLFALLDVSVGNRLFNSERRWSYVEFTTREQDQDGRTVETAKPIGYYWRGNNPPASGVGGFYLDNRASNHTVEDASYRKLREVQFALDLPRLPFLPGAWSVALTGRNLYTWTRYSGGDPETGYAAPSGNGSPNSAAITTGDAFAYPQTRTFTLALRGRI